ncbi:MAG: hypothetical protein NZ957_00240 [Thaumarchaeota archaeon]|nr:hypothetical protein [Candidatus Calditenuaceae archaeon]MDW8041206.1 hypothetical protein [Nitrososphaerota archaeon]
MDTAANLLWLIWPVVLAVAFVAVLVTVLSGLKRVTTELKLMREALQINVKQVPAEEEKEKAVPRPEVETRVAASSPQPPPPAAEEAVPPTPQEPPQPTTAEVREVSDLGDLLTVFGLKSVLLFDSAGHVVDSEGEQEPERLAALLAEAFTVILMANDRVRSFAMLNGGVEAVVRVAVVEEREIYAHFRAEGRLSTDEIQRLTESCRRVLGKMLEVR